jgi:hypothetical protein
MAFAASPSLSSLAAASSSSSAASAASFAVSASAVSYSSSSSPSNPSRELSPRLFSPLPPKPHSLSCSGPQAPRATTGDGSGAAGDRGSGSGGNSGKGGGGGSGSGGGDDDDDYEEAEFGPLLGFDEVLRLAAARGVSLPADMMEAAKDAGIREVLLLRYFDLQVIRIAEELFVRR